MIEVAIGLVVAMFGTYFISISVWRMIAWTSGRHGSFPINAFLYFGLGTIVLASAKESGLGLWVVVFYVLGIVLAFARDMKDTRYFNWPDWTR